MINIIFKYIWLFKFFYSIKNLFHGLCFHEAKCRSYLYRIDFSTVEFFGFHHIFSIIQRVTINTLSKDVHLTKSVHFQILMNVKRFQEFVRMVYALTRLVVFAVNVLQVSVTMTCSLSVKVI